MFTPLCTDSFVSLNSPLYNRSGTAEPGGADPTFKPKQI